MQPISYLSDAATAPSFSNIQQAGQIIDLITKAGAAIIVLLAITTISIYKPWGKIQLANRNQHINMADNGSKSKKSWTFYALIGLLSLLTIFIIMHLFGGGMPGH